MVLGADIIDAIKQSDLVGQVCNITAAVLSIISWSVFFQKFMWFRSMWKQSIRFQDECVENGGNLEESFRMVKDYETSPLARIFKETFIEFKLFNKLNSNQSDNSSEKKTVIKNSVERVIERTITDELGRMQAGLFWLATTANAGPLIGLLGSVWGILGAFQSLSVKGSISMGTLAPGIATALGSTVFGLAAAIPAAIMYNYFIGKIQKMTNEMEIFALEVQNAIDKHLLVSKSS